MKWRNSFLYDEHPNWKGGEASYKTHLRRSGRKERCERCKEVDPFVLVAHHMDMNRKNNDLKNLVWLCRNCHFLLHHYSEEKEKFYGRR